MSNVKGMVRRRKYSCSVCLKPIMEYPGLVIGNGHDLVCDNCAAKAIKPEPAPEPERFIYATRNRPPMYGTVPEGWQTVSEQRTETEPYGTISYERKLTPEELYKWELVPVSENAYTFGLNNRVLANEVDPATVLAHLPLGRYLVHFDATWTTSNVHVSNLELLYDLPAEADEYNDFHQ